MTDKAKKYLFDIRKAILLIEEFTTDITGFENYQQDAKTKSAVERQLGIIGEAVNQFRKLALDITLSHTKQMVDFRNRLIHAYDSLDDTIVWAILKKHLPILLKEVNEYIE